MRSLIDPDHKLIHRVDYMEFKSYLRAKRISVEAPCGKVWSPYHPHLVPDEVRAYCEECRKVANPRLKFVI